MPSVPDEVATRVTLGSGEKILAAAQDDEAGDWVVATTWRLVTVSESGEVAIDSPWLEVDSGSWDPDTWRLGVSWVDGSPVTQWLLEERTGPGRLPPILHDRVSASVVLTRHLDLGARRTARVVIRKDLRTRELVEQVLVSRGATRDDAELRDAVREARRTLRDQVGMPPVGG
jgi:hypothetical protein